MDFIHNGQPSGDVASLLMQHNGDPGCLRPFLGDDNRSYMTVNTGRTQIDPKTNRVIPIYNTIVSNTPATLRYDEWKVMDRAVMEAAKPQLKAAGDLRARGLQFILPNGMGKTVLEYQTGSDINDATVSMSPLRRSDGDRPVFDIGGLPLPIIHKDFSFDIRQIMTSRAGGYTPIDTSVATKAARKVAEEVEKMTLGLTTYKYAGYSIYGYQNHPNRMTKVMTLPTAAGWTPATTVEEVLEMRQQQLDAYFNGPWRLYTSPSWDIYLDDDYSAAKGDNTLRERLAKIRGIESIQTLDYLTGYTMLMVQMTEDVVRMVVGMEIQTIQWLTQGGMQLNFKVMCILVPQVRADYNSHTGIVHATAA